MSFGNQNQKTSVSLTPGGISDEDFSSSQESTPVPYLAGEGAISARWLCNSFDPDLVEIPAAKSNDKTASKAGGGSGSGRYNVFGSIGGLLCHGPIDEVSFVDLDSERKWTGPYVLGVSNPAPLSIPGIGNYDIMLGTLNQPSWGLPPVGYASVPHPRYNSFAGFVARHILYGEERPGPQSHRFGLRRRPRQSLVTGPAALLDDGQANPFAVLAEILTSPWVGLGLPASLFNVASWQAAADGAYAKRELCYVSVLLNSRIQAKTLAADLFVLCDGYWRVDRATGGCEVGLWPQPETINPSTLPLLTYRGLINPPSLSPQTLKDIITRYVINYTDRDKNFKVRSVVHNDPAARGGLGQDRTETIERLHIARRPQSLAHVREYARRNSLLGMAASLEDRGAQLVDPRPGQHIRADIELTPGGLELEKVFRIRSVNKPANGPAVLQVEAERTLVPIAYTPPETVPPQTIPDISAIAHAALLELPPQLADGGEFAVAILAERPEALVTACSVYYDPVNDSGSTFPLLGSHRSFALRAELSASATDSAGALALTLLSPLSRELIATDPGSVAARDNELLLFLVHAMSGGNRAYEIVSVSAIVATGADAITATVLRGRCGTAPLAHASACEAWFISRAALPWYRHADFATRAAGGQICYVRLQPGTDQASRPLEDCTPLAFVFDHDRAYAPVITLTTPSNPAGVEVNHALACSGSVTDADGNLVSLTILRVIGGLEEVIIDRNFAPSSSMSWSIAAIAFNQEGTAALVVRAQDSTRRTIEKRLTVIVGATGSGGTVPTDRLLPPVLSDSRLFVTPMASPYDVDWADVPSSPPAAGQTFVWVSARSPSIDGLPVHSPADGSGSVVPGTTPAIEHYAATSALGASTPETGWKNVQPYAVNTDNSDEDYIRNVVAGSAGSYASVWSDSMLRGVVFPRVEAGVRLWIYAHDIHGVKLDSEIVTFDLYF